VVWPSVWRPEIEILHKTFCFFASHHYRFGKWSVCHFRDVPMEGLLVIYMLSGKRTEAYCPIKNLEERKRIALRIEAPG
jgi:hypothetical protein